MKNPGLRLFLVLDALLIAALAWLWLDHHSGAPRALAWQPPAAIAPEFGAAANDLPPVAAMDTRAFVATLDRPLFSPTRRPPPPKAAPDEPPVADTLKDVRLIGLYTTTDGRAGALVRNGAAVQRVALKEQIGGWTLDSVQDRRATLMRAGKSRVLELAISRPAAAAAGARPARPAPAARKR